MKRIYRSYSVMFNYIFKPDESCENLKTVRELTVVIWASNLQEAIDEAWKAVTLSPEDYEITMVTLGNSNRISYSNMTNHYAS